MAKKKTIKENITEILPETNEELSVLEQVDLQLLENELKQNDKESNNLSEIIDSILGLSSKITNCTLTFVGKLYKCEIRFNQRLNSNIELYPGNKQFENEDINQLKQDISTFMATGRTGNLVIV